MHCSLRRYNLGTLSKDHTGNTMPTGAKINDTLFKDQQPQNPTPSCGTHLYCPYNMRIPWFITSTVSFLKSPSRIFFLFLVEPVECYSTNGCKSATQFYVPLLQEFHCEYKMDVRQFTCRFLYVFAYCY